MRPVICKCPNYSGCLLAYHNDDIEIVPDMPRVCPECGTALRVAPRARSDAFYNIINMLGLLAVGGAIWFAWPTIVRIWYKATTPPAKTAPAKR
jgi:uncharacterized protein (DUF983 family)